MPMRLLTLSAALLVLTPLLAGCGTEKSADAAVPPPIETSS